MGKMYYSEEQTARKLGVSPDQLRKLVDEAKLRVYSDGGKRMYNAEEVDTLAPAQAGESGEVELTPADSAAGDRVTLSEADRTAAVAGKDDTVITSEGISIFDDEDLEVEAGDPMAKTAIAPSVEEQISLEGVGSGSGLLDLTRESDDTSLGAEVLEHIDVESAVPSSSLGAQVLDQIDVEGAVPSAAEEAPPAAIIEAPTVVEEIDASAGAFSGLVLGAALVMLLVAAVVLPVMMDKEPGYLTALQENLALVLGASALLSVLLAVAGYLIGKSIADRATALQRGG